MPSIFGIMTSSRIRSGRLLRATSSASSPSAACDEFVAVGAEPRPQDVAVGLVVVDDEDARRIVHAVSSGLASLARGYSRTLASSWRGL